MKSINIDKTLNYENDSIKIKYNGIANDNINLDKIKLLLENFLNNHKHNSMIENITIIRTIMKECEEKLLIVSYQDKNGSELVKYENYLLKEYEKNNNEIKEFQIKYEPTSGISLTYNNHETNIKNYSDINLISKGINKMIEQIYNLNDTKKVILTDDDKALITIYKLFYNENPDFSNKDINIKIQTMMSILAEFGISIDDGFSLYKETKMPLSLALYQRVNKLYPLGKINDNENNIKLAEEAKRIIKIVGESVREKISNTENQNETLIAISKIIYAGRYSLSSNSDIKKISLFTGYKEEEIKSNIKLVKSIKNKINKS